MDKAGTFVLDSFSTGAAALPGGRLAEGSRLVTVRSHLEALRCHVVHLDDAGPFGELKCSSDARDHRLSSSDNGDRDLCDGFGIHMGLRAPAKTGAVQIT